MNWRNAKLKCKNEKCNKSLVYKGHSLDKGKKITCGCGTENLIAKKKNGNLIVL